MALTKIGTDGVKDDAITSGKIPANAVGSSELADNSVDTNAIQDQAVALSKLPHGTSSNDGKFLRANNGADPSFETVSIPAGTTINNNADNRVITGSGTANTLEGESNLTFNGTALGLTGYVDVRTGSSINTNSTASAHGALHKNTNSGEFAIVSGGTGGNNHLSFYTSASAAPTEKLRIDSSGKVGIGTTGYGGGGASPILYLRSTSGRQVKIHSTASGTCGLQLSNNTTGEGEDAGFHLAVLSTGDGYINNPHAKNIRFATTGTERLRILAGGGLTFNGDTAAANALDDYEQGTYTATITGQSAGSISLYSGDDTLAYTKIGNIVHIQGRIRLHIVNNSMSGQARLSLPFTAASGTEASSQGQSSVATHGVTLNESTDVGVFLESAGGSSLAYLNIIRYSQSWTAVTANQFGGLGATSNHYLAFNHTYTAA